MLPMPYKLESIPVKCQQSSLWHLPRDQVLLLVDKMIPQLDTYVLVVVPEESSNVSNKQKVNFFVILLMHACVL